MNGVPGLSKEHHSFPPESRRMPPAKRKNFVSYDSGFPEDERTNAVRRIRKSISVPDSRANHHNRLSHPSYNSQFDDGYFLRNLPQYSPDSAHLNAFHEDNSSDSEVFQKTKNCSVCEGPSCDELAVHPCIRPPRKKTNRSKLPKYSIQKDAPHSSKLAYQAIASYRGSTDGTIDLSEGDKVQVIRKSKAGWWFVKTDEQEGWAPSNYLEPVTCYEE